MLLTLAIAVIAKYHNKHFPLFAFQTFLEDVLYFESIDIAFDEEYRSLIGHKPCENRTKPSILDPANPYHNLAGTFVGRPKAITGLKTQAERTLKNIRDMQWDEGQLNRTDFEFWRIIEIFKPDPELFCDMPKFEMFIEFRSHAASMEVKTIDIRAGVRNSVRKQIEFMLVCLTAICKKAPGNNLKERFELVYKKKFPDSCFARASDHDEHANYNATICLRIDDIGGILIRFSIPDSAS